MNIPKPLERIKKFEEMGFGMFIHWGLYSQLGKGEWYMHIANIPKEEYVKLKETFTAEDFDADKIAKIAKNAGMKYIVLTTRHHEGFSLFDTCGLNDYDAPHSPAKRDLVKEFVDACNENDIVPFLYHTTLDWHNEDFNNDFPKYLEYLNKSVEILCTKYGKIGGLWFDGNWSKKDADWKEDELYSIIRKHQPEAIIINNSGMGRLGMVGHPELDSVTFEQGRPNPMNREGAPKYLAAEMCETMNCHWSIGNQDFNYKSLSYLIENLCACRKVGANYLLDIGPTAQGGVDKLQEAMLEKLGEWINIHSYPIYKGKPSEIQGKGKNFALDTDNNTTYLFIHNLGIHGDVNVTLSDRGAGPKLFENVGREIKAIMWMDNGEKISFMQDINSKVLCVNATPYSYGVDLVVRVAQISYE